jgi:ADP-heptose:LPS heptosyltransferase
LAHERWAEVLRQVRRQHPEHAIVLLGTGPEYALNQEIAALAGIDRLHNAADDLPIPRLVALLGARRGLITVDSGPAHAAAAVGCPQVVLFGKALPSLYRPLGHGGRGREGAVRRDRREAGHAGNRESSRHRGLVSFETRERVGSVVLDAYAPGGARSLARPPRAACPESPAPRRAW